MEEIVRGDYEGVELDDQVLEDVSGGGGEDLSNNNNNNNNSSEQ